VPALCIFSCLQTNLTEIKIRFFRYCSSSEVAEPPSGLRIYLERSQTLESFLLQSSLSLSSSFIYISFLLVLKLKLLTNLRKLLIIKTAV